MKQFGRQFLIIYSAVLSTVFAITLLTGASSHASKNFDEIRAHRIDIVEPNGTLRMVLSNHDRLPGVIVRGKEAPPFDRPQAGMLFYNDEGTENGGLIFGGHRNEKGEVVDSGGSLSFDQYGASQIVQIAGVDDKTDHFAGIAVNDKNRRIWVGRTSDGSASIALMDASGRKRIVMQVTDQGTPSLAFLDEKGRTLQRLVPDEKK